MRYCTALGVVGGTRVSHRFLGATAAVEYRKFHTTATGRGPTADFVIFAMSLFTNHHNDENRDDKMAYCLMREMSRGNRRSVDVVVGVGRSTGLS